MEPALHAEVEPIGFLLGTWRGEGNGEYPTIEPFAYGEEMRFGHVGEAFLLYSQRSWLSLDGSPSHFEQGFFRPGGPGRLEATLAHPLGIVEVAEGTVGGGRIDMVSTAIALTATGSAVTELRRRIRVEGDILRYELLMATEEVPLTRHLTAELRRVEG